MSRRVQEIIRHAWGTINVMNNKEEIRREQMTCDGRLVVAQLTGRGY